MKSLFRPCPLCAVDHGRPLGSLAYAVFDDCPLSSSFEVVACSACGFTFYNTDSTEAQFDEFYSKHYFGSTYLSGQIPSWLDAKYAGIARRLNGFLHDKKTPVYDVGCGTGGLLRHLSGLGYNRLIGVDQSAECLRNLGDEYKYVEQSVYEFTVNDFLEPCAVIYSEIFEHLLYPGLVLERAARSLPQGSIVYVTVPDAARYDEFNHSPVHFMLFEHINHFDAPHLEYLFGRHGFRMIWIDTQDHNIGEQCPFPMLHAVFQKRAYVDGSAKVHGENIADKVGQWFSKLPDSLDEKGDLRELAKSRRPVYVWGLSYRTQMFLAMSFLKDCNVKALVDNDPRKLARTIGGRNIFPDAIIRDGSGDSSAVVVIGPGPSAEAMRKKLVGEIGFSGDVVLL